MKFHRSIVLFMVLAMLTVAVPLTVHGDAADDAAISITDSRGVTTNLTAPAAHVASFGAFATNTLVDIGMLDKAVIFDASSEFNKSAIPEMQGMSADKFVTVSGVNKDPVIQKMLYLVDNGVWNKSRDVIFGYGYDPLPQLWAELEGYGFHVISFYPNSYNGIVQVVEDIESVTGADHAVSENMAFVKEYITKTIAENGLTNQSQKAKALYVSYSGGNMQLANNGSVTADFITSAGGINVAENPNKPSPRYPVDLTAFLLIEPNPEFALLDGYYPGTPEDFKASIGKDDMTVYKLNKSWNSYCPDATEGLWAVACLFYPEHFKGELPVDQGDGDDGAGNTMIYAIVGIAIVLVGIAAVFLLRRKD